MKQNDENTFGLFKIKKDIFRQKSLEKPRQLERNLSKDYVFIFFFP